MIEEEYQQTLYGHAVTALFKHLDDQQIQDLQQAMNEDTSPGFYFKLTDAVAQKFPELFVGDDVDAD